MIKVPHQRVVLHPLAHVAPTGGQASPRGSTVCRSS